MMAAMTELAEKLARVRLMMAANNVSAVHVAGLGNLAWLLCGADLAVALTGGARRRSRGDAAKGDRPRFKR